jgi:metal-responsive CopG/Arc/MetJ family transcriptional regulator
MKTAISLPDPLYEAADALAGRLGITRSELFRRALERLLSEYDDEQITDALNRVYVSESSALDPTLARMQAASLSREEW